MLIKSANYLIALLCALCMVFLSEKSDGSAINKLSLGSPSAYATSNLIDTKSQKMLLAQQKKKSRKKREHINETFEDCLPCENIEGFVPPEKIHRDIRRLVGKYKGGGGLRNVKVQTERGIFETGLYPSFMQDADCPEIDSEKWAIDYTYKRGRSALHRGVDIPQPEGTPIRAVADGTIVGRFLNDGRKDGIAVFLRHKPEQTGLPFWTYSHYTHLLEMSPLAIGTTVKMGDEIGKTSNSGKMGRRIRRDALHFAIFYSEFPEWSNDGSVVTPKDGYAMDPNAFYREAPPYDTLSMLELPKSEKVIFNLIP